MKALTIYQPWASLIMVLAKPYEFRTWNFGEKFPDLVGQRIVVHASARAVKLAEVVDLLKRLELDGAIGTGLKPEIAVPMLERVRATLEPGGLFAGKDVEPLELPTGAALGTATITRAHRAGELFKGVADSDRINQHIYAWPLQAIEPFKSPLPCRGLQGFWNFPADLEKEAGLRK